MSDWDRRHAAGFEVLTGKHLDFPSVGGREFAFGEELVRSGDPWRFSPLQLRQIWKVGTKVNVDLFASLVWFKVTMLSRPIGYCAA